MSQAKMKKPKQKTYQLTPEKYLAKSEQAELLRYLAADTPRNQLLVEVALATGARASEILNITLKDLHLPTKSVLIRGLKGSNDREIPLPKKLFARLYDIASNDKTKRPFPITYPRLVQIWRKHAPNGKTFHSLRHTFALGLYNKTKNLKLVQIALGHKTITNTMIYMDYSYSQSEMRKAMGVR